MDGGERREGEGASGALVASSSATGRSGLTSAASLRQAAELLLRAAAESDSREADLRAARARADSLRADLEAAAALARVREDTLRADLARTREEMGRLSRERDDAAKRAEMLERRLATAGVLIQKQAARVQQHEGRLRATRLAEEARAASSPAPSAASSAAACAATLGAAGQPLKRKSSREASAAEDDDEVDEECAPAGARPGPGGGGPSAGLVKVASSEEEEDVDNCMPRSRSPRARLRGRTGIPVGRLAMRRAATSPALATEAQDVLQRCRGGGGGGASNGGWDDAVLSACRRKSYAAVSAGIAEAAAVAMADTPPAETSEAGGAVPGLRVHELRPRRPRRGKRPVGATASPAVAVQEAAVMAAGEAGVLVSFAEMPLRPQECALITPPAPTDPPSMLAPLVPFAPGRSADRSVRADGRVAAAAAAVLRGGVGVPCRCSVRNRDQRLALQGYDCEQCRDFYKAAGVAPEAVAFRRGPTASRHRFEHAPTSTPEGFWDLSFPQHELAMAPIPLADGAAAGA